jgi:hypothetical protein
MFLVGFFRHPMGGGRLYEMRVFRSFLFQFIERHHFITRIYFLITIISTVTAGQIYQVA